MRLGPVVHGGLLLVALVISYQTSTRQQETGPKRGRHTVWKVGAVSALVFETDTKVVRIEERRDELGSYYWGEIERTKKVAKPPGAGPTNGDAGPPPPTELPETLVSIREFPVGEAGEELMQQFQSLMALRKLGPIKPEKLEYYNLHEKTNSLTLIESAEKQHSLLIAGEKIYGGTDRYVLDVDTSTGYVLSGKLIQPLESAESSLSIKKVHSFNDEKVTSIAITTTAGDKVLRKGVRKEEAGEHVVWSYEGSSESSHAALGVFVDRVAKLKPTRYESEIDPSTLVHIATLRYKDEGEASLGYLELYRQLPSAQETTEKPRSALQTQYYIKTERTRVLGKVGRLGADRVDQDLVALFGIAPPPVSPVAPSVKPVAPVVPPTPKAPAQPAPKAPTSPAPKAPASPAPKAPASPAPPTKP